MRVESLVPHAMPQIVLVFSSCPNALVDSALAQMASFHCKLAAGEGKK